MTQEIKPCPFCGDANADTGEGEWGQGYPFYWVKCDCGAEMGGHSKAEAITAWSTRPAPDMAAVVEALEWYGEQARLCRLIHSEGDEGRHNLQADGGNKARAALQSLRDAS